MGTIIYYTLEFVNKNGNQIAKIHNRSEQEIKDKIVNEEHTSTIDINDDELIVGLKIGKDYTSLVLNL